jgi:hypothetical protein
MGYFPMVSEPKSHGRLSISASLQPRDLMTPTPRLKGAWTAKVLTLFPDAFPGVLGQSLTGKTCGSLALANTGKLMTHPLAVALVW